MMCRHACCIITSRITCKSAYSSVLVVAAKRGTTSSNATMCAHDSRAGLQAYYEDVNGLKIIFMSRDMIEARLLSVDGW